MRHAVFCLTDYLFNSRTEINGKNMQKRHTDRESYFEEQSQTSRNYYIPYIKEIIGTLPDKVLEVGCGEGGNLLPFAQSGCRVAGIDIDSTRIEQAKTFFAQRHQQGEFMAANIFQIGKKEATDFPLILLHDVIEHIEDKALLLSILRSHLSAGGVLFVGFPAWQMPFGGHQQIAHSPIIAHLPFIHLLPRTLYKWILRLCGEPERTITELLNIKSTGCTIEMFHRLARQTNYQVINRRLYLINPHYKTKFGLSPRRLHRMIAAIPYLRNFFCTSCFYILRKA